MLKTITLVNFLSVLDIGIFGVAERFGGTFKICGTSVGRLLWDACNGLAEGWWCKIGPADTGRYGSGAGGLLLFIFGFLSRILSVFLRQKMFPKDFCSYKKVK